MATEKTDSKQVAAKRRDYFMSLPPDARRLIKQIRASIRAAAPDAVEVFSYGIPGFKLDGKPLIWYAAWKQHLSFYPMSAAIRNAHAAQLEGCEASKGTIRFPLSNPPSPSLVKRLTNSRIAELKEAT